MAPEVLASGRYSAASDRYSFGALTFFVLTGQNPPIDLAAVRSGFEQLPAVSTQPELIEHLMQMFDSDPAQRPPAGDWIRFFRVSGTTSLGSPVGLQPTAPLGAVVPPTELAAQDEPKRRRGLWTVLAVAVILALVAAGVAYAMNRHTPSEQASSQLSAAQLRRESTHSVKKKASSRPKTTGTSTSSTTSTPTVPDNSSAAPYGLSSSNTCCGSQQAATGPVNINGQQYLDSIYGTFLGAGAYNCSTGSSITYDYDLERQYSTFTATIGETDGSDLGVTAQFDVYLDSSNHAFSQVLSQGQSVPISVNVTGALTLTLTMTLTSSNCNDQGEVDAAWGNAQVAS
jgi:type II secretory pathway pseudopilin PulG